MIRYRLWSVLVLCLVLSGCGRPLAQNLEGKTTSVPADEPPPLTPAELDRQYRLSFNEGLRLAHDQQYGLALGAFERAATLKPASPEALFNLGACHEAIGDPMRAVSFYHRVLQITPDDSDCYANLGTSFIKMYHRERTPVWRKMALEAWRRSLELNPHQTSVRGYLVRAEADK